MKRLLSILLALTMLWGLVSCGHDASSAVTFYYPKDLSQPDNSGHEEFYATEIRKHEDSQDLHHFISAYLKGPLDAELVSPFPRNTVLVDLELLDDLLVIHLSKEFSQLSGIRLTIACACLSLTVFGLTEAAVVRIVSPATGKYPAVDITIRQADLILTDTVTGAPGSGNRKDAV